MVLIAASSRIRAVRRKNQDCSHSGQGRIVEPLVVLLIATTAQFDDQRIALVFQRHTDQVRVAAEFSGEQDATNQRVVSAQA
jgi:hypothetical protein